MIQVNDIYKTYKIKDKYGNKSTLNAVNGVSFTLKENTSYSLVGQSGSGKSTLARLLVFVENSTKGEIFIDGENLSLLSKNQIRKKRSDFQMVMQDAKSSLNPKYTVFESISEPLLIFEKLSKNQLNYRVMNLLKMVELPQELAKRYPHQLSGGQLKRICIARAISLNPKLIVFDEAVSGLDVTVRKKILELLIKLRKKLSATYLFITHDIDVALFLSKKVFVMKDGVIVEYNQNANDFSSFKHEYSKLLIKSLPPVYPGQDNNLRVNII